MSKLKSVHAFDVYEAYLKTGDDDAAQVYRKSEADKVIAELKAQKAQAEDDCAYWKTMSQSAQTITKVMAKQRADAFKRVRHHKYKRCLAMAKLCAKNVDHLNSEGYIYEKEGRADEVNDCIKGTQFYHKWYERWLKIAEQFEKT